MCVQVESPFGYHQSCRQVEIYPYVWTWTCARARHSMYSHWRCLTARSSVSLPERARMPAAQRESQVHVCTSSPSTSTHNARARTSGGSGSHASPPPPGLAVVIATLRRCRCRYRCVVLPPRRGRCGVRGVEELVVVLVRRVRLRGRAAPPRRRRAGLDGDHRRGGAG